MQTSQSGTNSIAAPRLRRIRNGSLWTSADGSSAPPPEPRDLLFPGLQRIDFDLTLASVGPGRLGFDRLQTLGGSLRIQGTAEHDPRPGGDELTAAQEVVLHFPQLAAVGGRLSVAHTAGLTTVRFPQLSLVAGASFGVQGNPDLRWLELGRLEGEAETVEVGFM